MVRIWAPPIWDAVVKLISQGGIHFSWSGRLGSTRSKQQQIPCLERAAFCFTDGSPRLCPHTRDSKQVPRVLFCRVIIIPVFLRVLWENRTNGIDSEGISQFGLYDTVWVVQQQPFHSRAAEPSLQSTLEAGF